MEIKKKGNGGNMRLVIGGYAQGKLDYVLFRYGIREDMVWDARLPEADGQREGIVVVNHMHLWVKSRLADGGCPEEEILAFLEQCGDCILICDEIGNGIVPSDPEEREYRERTGRILVRLAGMAEGVERIICGISQRIK